MGKWVAAGPLCRGPVPDLSGTQGPRSVSYTHLTLPTILLV